MRQNLCKIMLLALTCFNLLTILKYSAAENVQWPL